MSTASKILSDLLGFAKSWIPWRSEPSHVSRDFWMPDESCRVCYECDSQFTLINRRHHCRLCGRVFCAKCTANSVPAQASDPSDPREEFDKIRVCNFCFKQWEKGIASATSNGKGAIADLSISPSGASFTSSKSSCNVNSSTVTLGSMPSVEPSQQVSYDSMISPRQSKVLERNIEKRQGVLALGTGEDHAADLRDPSSNKFGFCINRNDDDSDEYSGYQFDTRSRNFFRDNLYLRQTETDVIRDRYISPKSPPDGGNVAAEGLSNSKSFDSHSLEVIQQFEKKDENCIGDECETLSSISAVEEINDESVDFENNALLWLPPEPQDEEDEREAPMFDDDDDEDAAGEWGYLQHSHSFGNGEHRARDKSCEDHKKAMKNVVDGHFRALLSQLLLVENLPFTEDDDGDGWLEIITSLSWEAATLLKPDTSIGGGMDPGGYVKVKCLASGRRCDSLVVKGVVCKKNLAHRRMTSNIEKPRLLILGGALEYQRVSNLFSSVDTLLRQEMDHLKMAVARIDSHQPDILLVEKSVSRFAQEYLLAKDISLVLNIKRPLLERIARCTGAEIVPSIDSLSSPNLGYCDKFHIQRFLEEHGSVGQNGKKSVKTLMYLEGCPKPLGCTILLRGANEGELKKVKHVIQYGVFAAYHLALETSFLADEGASIPELPLNSPITVAFPDRSTSIEKSISMVPGFSVPPSPRAPHFNDETKGFHNIPTSWSSASLCGMEMSHSPNILDGDNGQYSQTELTFVNAIASLCDSSQNNRDFLGSCWTSEDKYCLGVKERTGSMITDAKNDQATMLENLNKNSSDPTESVRGSIMSQETQFSGMMVGNQTCNSQVVPSQRDAKDSVEEPGSSKEVFPPSPSDHQSILVSLSSRCFWKGTVCERSHLFRIKYYGSFDKPLGRFLRDHLFDPCYRCRSCEMPSEAHVQCYTHRQGTLTISVKNLPEIFLPGEREGKIWMWHRCLLCRRTNGFPPATRRVVMSDAAWGLSFGKFLELSFSNHAAASRVASCGHSLHRDCLRFYGFGKKVACFSYESIDVHSVYLPPPKLEFNYEGQDWIQKEFDEVADRAELLFSEVLGAIHQKLEKFGGIGASNSCIAQSESRHQLVELKGMLQREKVEFEASLKKSMNGEVKTGELVIDILEINRLRRQLSFQAYIWEHRLTYADSLHSNNLQESLGNVLAEDQGKPSDVNSMVNEMSRDSELYTGFTSCEAQVTNHGESKNCNDEDGDKKLSITDAGVDFPAENAAVEDLTYCTPKVNNSEDSDNSLQPENFVQQALSDVQFPAITNLSDSLDAAWTGENFPETGTGKHNSSSQPYTVLSDPLLASVAPKSELEVHSYQEGSHLLRSFSSVSFTKDPDNLEDSVGWLRMPFLNFYRSLNKNFLGTAQKLDTFSENKPIYVPLFFESEIQNGARLLLPIGMNETVIPVYDDEPSSIISYALVSAEYSLQLSDDGEKIKDGGESTISLPSPDPSSLQSFRSSEEITSGCHRRLRSADDSFLSMIGSRNSQVPDPLSYTKTLHARVSFGDDSPLGKVKYTVTCYYAKKFEALRKICCPSELDYIRSLSRCKKWRAQGGKSNVFFAKTSDDRFIIKQVTKTELDSFIKFAPGYFKYLTDSISSRSPTCLAKILGIYQITSRYLKGAKESKMDVLVMENLLFGKKSTQLYDLKGSSRSRYNPDSSGSNKVLLDQNLIETMPTSPIFVSNKAKRLLERAVWNDTAFLASIDVMDYSLLVGVDKEKHELVLGIIDFVRQYTWDKHLETWVKASGILGGPKNASPTVISPKQYKKRFRKAMTTYFLMVPDQWSSSTNIPSKSQTDMGEENTKAGSDSTEQ